jgi:hypothetical protein
MTNRAGDTPGASIQLPREENDHLEHDQDSGRFRGRWSRFPNLNGAADREKKIKTIK